jgi:hypothetical protein
MSQRSQLQANHDENWASAPGPKEWPALACRILWAIAAVIGVALAGAGCARPAGEAAALLGRWQRVGQSGIYEPMALASEFIELRADGQVLILLWDQQPDEWWLVGSEAYSVPERGQLELTGWCWRGQERYSCTRRYRFTLDGDVLHVFEGEAGQSGVIYRRLGPPAAEIPPTLAPPMPTPLPAAMATSSP